jgi:molybdopterin converting factor small subunit
MASMARVTLIGPLRDRAGTAAELDLDVATIRELLKALAHRFPALAEDLEAGVAVAIDGEIYQDHLLQPIPADADVQVLPPLAGG